MIGHAACSRQAKALQPHIHQSAEFLCLASGSQKYCVGDREYVIKGNQVLVVDKDQLHSTGESPYGRYENIWFRLNVETFAIGLGLPEEMKEALIRRLCNMKEPIISLKENHYCNLREAFYDLVSENPVRRLSGFSGFVDFVMLLVQSSEGEVPPSGGLQPVLDNIQENTGTHLMLEDLAELAGLSLSGFKQKFRREIGITPREYINLKKIEKAKTLLTQGMSVTDTAFSLGFSSSSYFRCCFDRWKICLLGII